MSSLRLSLLEVLLALQLVSAGVIEEMAARNSIVQANIYDDRSKLEIYCEETPSHAPDIASIYPTFHIKTVTFVQCPPIERYCTILTTFGVNVEEIEELTLQGIPVGPAVLQARHLEELPNVATLSIYPKGNGFRPERDFLKDLRKLKILKVSNMVLPAMPASPSVEVVVLKGGSSEGDWGGCQDLRSLKVEEWALPEGGARWLERCANLVSLKISNQRAQDVERLVSGTPNLSELMIQRCDVTELTSHLLGSAQGLRVLRVTNSSLSNIASDTFGPSLQQSLLELNLSNNSLNGAAIQALRPLQKIRILSLADNPALNDFCDHVEGGGYISQVSQLYMRNTGISKLCFRDWRALTDLDLNSNRISYLDFEELPLAVSRERALAVRLHGDHVRDINFPRALYESLATLRKNTQPSNPGQVADAFATIDASLTLKCDSDHFYLKRALDEDLISIEEWSCVEEMGSDRNSPEGRHHGYPGLSGPTHTMPVMPEDYYPTSHPHFPPTLEETGHSFNCGGCKCDGSNDGVLAWCGDGKISAIPHIEGLKEFYADGSNIEKLEVGDLPATLKVLDLTNNKIARLSGAAAEALFASERRVFLKGNPIACDCDNKPLLVAINDHQLQVDFNQLTCAGSTREVRSIKIEKLCATNEPDAATTSQASRVVVAITLLAVLYLDL